MNRKLIFQSLCLFACAILFSFFACNTDKNQGNNAIIRLVSEPEKLNPLTTEEGNAMLVMSQIFMPLLDFDPKTLELMPALAKTRPTVIPLDTGLYKGGTAYVYEIRDEAMWDNGKPVTAADYVFTVKAILNKKTGASNLRSGLDFVKDIVVDAQNPKKFTVFSDKRYIKSEINSGTLPILPEYVYDTEGVLQSYTVLNLAKTIKDTTLKPDEKLTKFGASLQTPKFSREKTGIIGCGPYVFDNWVSGQSLTVKKKENWWGDKLATQSPLFTALPELITYKPVKDNATATSLMQNGELDANMNISPKDFNTLKKDEKMAAQYEFAVVPLLSLAHLGFNCKDPKLADKRVRRAVAHVVDVEAIIKTLAGGFATPTGSPILPQRPYCNADLKPIAVNIDQAKSLLTEAGWKDSNGDGTVDKKIGGKTTELVLRFVFATSEQSKNLGLMMQESAKKAGIGIQLEPVEAPIMMDNFKKRNFDIFYNAWGLSPGLDDPKEIWASSSNTPDGGNRYQFENKQVDALIEQIRGELNEEKRNALYKQFQQIIYDEQPAVFMFVRQERIALHKRFDAPVMLRRPGFAPNTFKLKK